MTPEDQQQLTTSLNTSAAAGLGEGDIVAGINTLTHNLLTRFEETIREEADIDNTTNRKRLAKRLEQAENEARQLGVKLPRLYKNWQRLKQTGANFIRCSRSQIFNPTSWVQSLHLLRQTYATFKT